MGAQPNPDYRFLDEQYTAARFYTQPLDSLDSKLVAGMLDALAERYGDHFHYEVAGHSVQKRPIHLVTLGRGPKKVLLWSQMHGDEPTATGALFDVFNYLMMHRGEPFTQAILDSITIYAVPMLNPDGTRQSSRRNAQGLDINRDARDRQTPEGRLLIELKDRLQPDFGLTCITKTPAGPWAIPAGWRPSPSWRPPLMLRKPIIRCGCGPSRLRW
ncbi:MAG: hypothetical protein IIA60_07670 [Candidatus Marinimicrobia bacterium]|nr:hypothetical protein [Candidatus Neomarinimicrobiota bacterium]